MRNIRILCYQPAEVLADSMARARAFVFAAEERFSIDDFEKHLVAAVHAALATSNWGCA